MLKANFKNVFFLTLVSTFITLSGCKKPEEKRADTIEKAQTLTEEGSNAEALKLLEDLATQYPNDVEILESIGRIYSSDGDHTMAAFFLEQAHLQAPDDTELLFQTYASLESANQPAGHLLEKLAEQAPGAMTPELRIRLGQNRAAENKLQPALDAYLKGSTPNQANRMRRPLHRLGNSSQKSATFPKLRPGLRLQPIMMIPMHSPLSLVSSKSSSARKTGQARKPPSPNWTNNSRAPSTPANGNRLVMS